MDLVSALHKLLQQAVPTAYAPTGKPSFPPGFTDWQKANQQYLPNNVQQNLSLYNRAVSAPSGHYYHVPQQSVLSSSASPFNDFTTSKVPPQYAQLIASAASQNNINPNVLASLLFTEHGLQPTPGYNYNTDGSYDRGIAQINSKAHPEITDEQANNPNFAIPWAAKTLGGHVKNLGLKRGIVAYNTGENGALGVSDVENYPYYKKVTGGLSQNLKTQLGL